MADFRKRLTSFFKKNTVADGSEGRVEARGNSERPIKETPIAALKGEGTVTPSQTRGSPPNPSPQMGNPGAPGKPSSHFENSELFLEIKANSVTAKAPWGGKLISFQTAAWDRKPSELDLPGAAMEELNEAYVYVRLANRLVWLSEDLGRSSEEIGENYAKMCKNIAERLDSAMLLATGGIEQARKPLEPAAVTVEKNQGASEADERRVAAELVAKEAQEQRVAAELDAKEDEELRAAPESVAKQTQGRRVAAQRNTKQARGRVGDKRGIKAEAYEEDKQLFRGITTFYVAQGAQGVQITALMHLLTETHEIKVLSSGGAAGQRSWVILSIDTAMPLLQVLGKMPIVRKVSKWGNEIEVMLTAP